MGTLIEAAQAMPFTAWQGLGCLLVSAFGFAALGRFRRRQQYGVPCYLCRGDMTAMCSRCTPVRPVTATSERAAA